MMTQVMSDGKSNSAFENREIRVRTAKNFDPNRISENFK